MVVRDIIEMNVNGKKSEYLIRKTKNIWIDRMENSRRSRSLEVYD